MSSPEDDNQDVIQDEIGLPEDDAQDFQQPEPMPIPDLSKKKVRWNELVEVQSFQVGYW